jgi:putative membrane protein insertion efficiency factor
MIKGILIFLLDIYKKVFSGLLKALFGGGCRFTPTCSDYSREAIEKHGIFLGSALSVKRVIKCNPFTKVKYDPVP